MDRILSENNLSSSFQTTLAVGGALALVAGAVIHRHKDKLPSLFKENLTDDNMNQNIDWQKLTISAQVRELKKWVERVVDHAIQVHLKIFFFFYCTQSTKTKCMFFSSFV